MGILTDGRRWLLRWPGAGAVRTTYPYAFTLENPELWIPLFEWLRDKALVSVQGLVPDREIIEQQFGPGSPTYERDIASLRTLYNRNSHNETIKVKRQLWFDLLRTALGENAEASDHLDDLFVRHTYLTAVIGMVVQASFGVDIHRLAETQPEDLLYGREFRDATGLQGIVESDFFAWPAEVGGQQLMRAMAHRIARFDWGSDQAPSDIAAILYESVIPPEERRYLGEYYTPAWLAKAMVRELVADPLNQSVLDPACGSGTFIAEAVSHFIAAAKSSGMQPSEVFSRLRHTVTGIDVHPVAVHLARSAYVLAAKPAIENTSEPFVSVPIYLGDALQLRFRSGDLFAEHDVTIQVDDEQNTTLVFPISLVERADTFDALMGDIAEHIERGEDPKLALQDHDIEDPNERKTLESTLATMQRLHSEGRNHIWAYYTRNMVRPVALSRSKVDIILGNPPWLNYNKTSSILRRELKRQSEDIYDIWEGGQYATHQDVAGLFFTRSVDLYLREGGTIGMVLPHSALRAGQYNKWRIGSWSSAQGPHTLSVNFRYKRAWDLESLEPNSFFPVPASVVFAKSLGMEGKSRELKGEIEQWQGAAGSVDMERIRITLVDTSDAEGSPYAGHSRQGATIVPRCLLFVNLTESAARVRTPNTVVVNPRRGSSDNPPWKDLDLTAISEQTVETEHVFDVHLGETVVPYATLTPLKSALPLKRGDRELPMEEASPGGIDPSRLIQRMRRRWQTVSSFWEDKRGPRNKKNLAQQIDYYGKLSSQLKWQEDCDGRPIRIVYTKAGRATAAIVHDRDAIIDHLLYWITCRNLEEAYYLLAIINSNALYEAAKPFMAKGQFGPRDLHKHLWKLPIPEYDQADALHIAVARAAQDAERGAAQCLADFLETKRAHGQAFTVTTARAELRDWLQSSEEGKAAEELVDELLASWNS